MRILVISQFYVPDITAAAFRIGDLVEIFADAGHQVIVIAAEPHKARAEGQDPGADHERVEVMRCPIEKMQGSGARAYIVHYLSFVRGSAGKGIALWRRGWKPDIVFVSSPPLFAGLSGRLLSVLFRRPMVFEVRDIWPDSAVAAGQLRSSGLAYRVGRMLERYLYRVASHITCVSRPMKVYLQEQSATPVSVVYNGVMAGRHELSVGERRSSEHRTVLYAGNIGYLQELDLLARGFAELVEHGEAEGWRVRVIGAGAQRAELIDLTTELGIADRFTVEAALPREQVFQEMVNADLLYLNLKQNPTLALTIPSKVFDYLLAARPIIAGLAGEGCDILNETGANVCFPPGDVQALKLAILDGFARCGDLSTHAAGNRKLVLQRFTRQRSAKELLEIFRNVSEKR